MTIVHVFLRTVKKKEFVMADSSTDSWSRPMFSSPVPLFRSDGRIRTWPKRVIDAISAKFPGIYAGEPCWPNRVEADIRCFDIPFYEKNELSWYEKLKNKFLPAKSGERKES